MKKYNLNKIMTRAWEIVKREGKTISVGLKRAWAEAKKGVKMVLKGSEKQIAWAEDILRTARETVDFRLNYYRNKLKNAGEYDDIRAYEDGVKASEEVKRQLERAIEPFETAEQVIEKRKFISQEALNKMINDLVYQAQMKRVGF